MSFDIGDTIGSGGNKMNSIFDRCSIRKFKKEALKKEEIDLILKAAFCAPSAKNCQPWYFIVTEDPKKLKELSEFSPYAKLLAQATLGVVVCADTTCNPSLDYCQQDCAAATQNMLIEAKELNIGSCWLGGYPNLDRVQKLKTYFNLPENTVPLWMVAFGYPDQKQEPKDKFKESKIRYE